LLIDAELLAIVRRMGMARKGVRQLAEELLRQGSGGFVGQAKTWGTTKRAEIVAVLELARPAMVQELQKRGVFADPNAVKHYM
jgi:DNA repair protein RadC